MSQAIMPYHLTLQEAKQAGLDFCPECQEYRKKEECHYRTELEFEEGTFKFIREIEIFCYCKHCQPL